MVRNPRRDAETFSAEAETRRQYVSRRSGDRDDIRAAEAASDAATARGRTLMTDRDAGRLATGHGVNAPSQQ